MSNETAAVTLGKLRKKRRRRSQIAPGLAPLLDVLFLLLIFLLVAANFDQRVVVPVDLPEVTTGSAPDDSSTEPILIVIDAQGRIEYEGQRVDLAGLHGELMTRPVEDRLRQVFIQGDATAELGSGMAVLDLLRREGFGSVAFQVENKMPGEDDR